MDARQQQGNLHCTFAPEEYKLPEGVDARLTYNPAEKKLYVHLFEYPASEKLILPGYKDKVRYAQLLNDNSELIFKSSENPNAVEMQLPKVKPPYEVPMIELLLK